MSFDRGDINTKNRDVLSNNDAIKKQCNDYIDRKFDTKVKSNIAAIVNSVNNTNVASILNENLIKFKHEIVTIINNEIHAMAHSTTATRVKNLSDDIDSKWRQLMLSNEELTRRIRQLENMIQDNGENINRIPKKKPKVDLVKRNLIAKMSSNDKIGEVVTTATSKPPLSPPSISIVEINK